jgi:hypothetical protein
MTDCDRVQIGLEMRMRGAGGPPVEAHVATCAACGRYAEVAAMTSARLRARAHATPAAPDPARVRESALAKARVFRRAVIALVAVDVLGAAAMAVLVGPWWGAAMLAAGLPAPVVAWWVFHAQHRRLVAGTERGGDLFGALRQDVRTGFARVRWMAPALVVGGIAMALFEASDLPRRNQLGNALSAAKIAFHVGFVVLGVYLMTRLPAMRRELADLGDA